MTDATDRSGVAGVTILCPRCFEPAVGYRYVRYGDDPRDGWRREAWCEKHYVPYGDDPARDVGNGCICEDRDEACRHWTTADICPCGAARYCPVHGVGDQDDA